MALSRRTAAALVVVACLPLASCGGGGGGGVGVNDPLLVTNVQFIDATGARVHEIEGGKIPRNARIEITFNHAVDASTARDPGIHIATSAVSSPELGLFKVSGSKVVFDPTVVTNNVARPLGMKAETTYLVNLPTLATNGLPVRDANGNALALAHQTAFTTGAGHILETVRPRFIDASFSSGTPTTPGAVVGARVSVTFNFSEAIEPSSLGFSVSTPKAKSGEGLDIRYVTGNPANAAAGIESVPILGTAMVAPTLDRITFYPADSYGDGPYAFTLSVLWGIRDLAGNTLENPSVLGPFICDGRGAAVPSLLGESFLDAADRDDTPTTADWNGTHPGVVRGGALTSRRSRITAAGLMANGTITAPGQYAAYVDPLVGAALQIAAPGTNPVTALGRRVMTAFGDDELGPSGAITDVAWGPDSNATFAATYSEVIIRFGQKKTPSLALLSSFSANYATAPTVVYDGPYTVPQRANIGNEFPPFAAPTGAGYAALAPLFANTGFLSWPAPTSYFEWDAGTTALGDSALLLDISAKEGQTWQQFRGWFGVNPVAPIGAILMAYRRMFSTFNEDVPNPAATIGTLNPEPGFTETAFTIVTRTTIAESRFYTPGATDPAGNSYPGPDSAARTFGVKSDYAAAVISPSVQPGSATVSIEYQGAMALDPTSSRRLPDLSKAVTPWTANVDTCDGYPYLRWRLTLRSDIQRGELPEVDSVAIPVKKLP